MGATPRTFKPGDRLFGEGEPSTSLFIIKKGVVAVRKRKGQTHIDLAQLHSNEVLGELSFFDRLPRSATAIAVTEVDAIEIDFESLDMIYSNVPPYFKTIMAAVAARLRRANETIRRLQKQTVELDDLKTLESETGTGGSQIDQVASILAGDKAPGEEGGTGSSGSTT